MNLTELKTDRLSDGEHYIYTIFTEKYCILKNCEYEKYDHFNQWLYVINHTKKTIFFNAMVLYKINLQFTFQSAHDKLVKKLLEVHGLSYTILFNVNA